MIGDLAAGPPACINIWMKAHQRIIRDREAAARPRPTVPLDGCTVHRITTAQARRIILRYEWLGTMPPRPVACYGLLSPTFDILGAVVFGHGNGSNTSAILGPENRDRVFVLERGACVPYAHEHAASFLISRALKLLHRDTGALAVVAYSDAEAGETGVIYRACNFEPLSVNRSVGRWRWYGRPDPASPWIEERAMRRLSEEEGWTTDWWWWLCCGSGATWELRKVYDKKRWFILLGDRRLKRETRRRWGSRLRSVE